MSLVTLAGLLVLAHAVPTLTSIPERPVVVASDLSLGEARVAGPWARVSYSVYNDADVDLTAEALEFTVTSAEGERMDYRYDFAKSAVVAPGASARFDDFYFGRLPASASTTYEIKATLIGAPSVSNALLTQ